jgi:hypothetical protein
MIRMLGTACIALLLAGCGTVGSGVRDEGAAALGDKAAVSPAAAAGENTSAAVPAPSAPGTAFVYLLRYDQPEPTRRSVASDLPIPEASVRALLAGPTAAEVALHYSSALPPAARLLAFSMVRRTAIVDVSQMPATAAGNETEALLALYQLVYTVTASGAIDAVQIRVAGRPFGLNALAGGSSALEPPLTRADLSFVIDATTLAGSTGCAVEKDGAAPFSGTPTVTIVRPRTDEPVTDSIQLRGTVANAAGPLVIRILQDQLEVANRIIDEPCRGRFAAAIPVPRTLTGPVTLVVISPPDDERDGAVAERSLVIAG